MKNSSQEEFVYEGTQHIISCKAKKDLGAVRLTCTFYCYFILLSGFPVPSPSCLTSRSDLRVQGPAEVAAR